MLKGVLLAMLFMFGVVVGHINMGYYLYMARKCVLDGTHVWAVQDGWPVIIKRSKPKEPWIDGFKEFDRREKERKLNGLKNDWEKGLVI